MGTSPPTAATLTPSASATPTPGGLPPPWQRGFRGTIFLILPTPEGAQAVPRRQRGVRVALYGSTEPFSLGDLIGRAQSGPDGTFGFSFFTEVQTEDFPYYFLAVDDPNYTAVAIAPGSEGEAIGNQWIRFTNPSEGDHGGNRIDVQPSGAPPQTVLPDVVPVWNERAG